MDKEAVKTLNEYDFLLTHSPAEYGRIKEEFSQIKKVQTKTSTFEYITEEQVSYMTGSVFGFISLIIIIVLLKESLTSLLELTKLNNGKK